MILIIRWNLFAHLLCKVPSLCQTPNYCLQQGDRLGQETQRLWRSVEGILFQALTLTQESKLDSRSEFPRDILISPSVEPPEVLWLLSSSFCLDNVMSHNANNFSPAVSSRKPYIWERQISYDIIYMWNQKNSTNELNYKTETDSQT